MKSDNPDFILIYDLETNGTSREMDRILEVYMELHDLHKSRLNSKFHSLVKVENNHIDLYAFHKNGWTEEFLNKNGRPLKSVMQDTYGLLHKKPGTILVGYFIRTFDNIFLAKMQRRYGLPVFDFNNSFDIALEFKAELAGLYNRFKKEDWRIVHEMVLKNDYAPYIRKSGYGMSAFECCRFYGVPVDVSKQHNAKYDTGIAYSILKKQRPEWFSFKQPTNATPKRKG